MSKHIKTANAILANSRKSLLVNVVSLSVSISIGGPRLRKTFSNCWITVGATYRRSGRHIANLEGPQSMIVRKFLLLWWLMSIANLFQLPFTPSFPFVQQTGAGSIDHQVSQAFTTELAVSLDTCGSTNLAKYKVCFAPSCPL